MCLFSFVIYADWVYIQTDNYLNIQGLGDFCYLEERVSENPAFDCQNRIIVVPYGYVLACLKYG